MWLFLIVFIFILSYLFVKLNENYRKVDYIPGPTPLPILGNSLAFVGVSSEDVFKKLKDLQTKYGKLYRMWIGKELWIVISDPKDVEEYLTSPKLLTKSNDYEYLKPWLGTGLLTSTGKKWHTQRKIITPAFHFKILEQFLSVIDKQVAVLAEKWSSKVGRSFDICEDITLCSMDIICETSMGVSIESQRFPHIPYYQAIRKLANIMHNRMFNPFLGMDFIFRLTKYHSELQENLKIITDFNNDIIKKRRVELKNGDSPLNISDDDDLNIKKKMAFMDILLQSEINGQPLTDDEIREEVNTFMFAGHDTVSSALTFLLYNVAKHENVQTKLIEEIDSVFGDDKKSEITYGKLSDLHYMDLVIKESLRVYPPVAMFGRENQEDMLINGRLIPKGSNLSFGTYLMHMDEDNFPDPELFIPERFDLTSSTMQTNPFCYIPFSAGSRNCVGQRFANLEMKIILLRILMSFQLSVPDDYVEPILISELVLKPKNGMKLILCNR